MSIFRLHQSLIKYVVGVLLLAAAPAFAQPRWTPEAYARYTFETFANLPAARAPIDLGAVDLALLHAAVFYETNRQRVAHNLPRFGYAPALEHAALEHSRDMVTHDFFSHESPVVGKTSFGDRLARVGLEKTWLAENLAITFGIAYESGKPVYAPAQPGGAFSYQYQGAPIPPHTYLTLARSVVADWMNSPGHRANILEPNLRFLGVGAAHYRDPDFHDIDKFKVTQNFAGRRGPPPATPGTDGPPPALPRPTAPDLRQWQARGTFGLQVRNECATPVRLLLAHRDAHEAWRTAGWFTIAPGTSAALPPTTARRFYYYAYNDTGEWAGAHAVLFDGQTYPFREVGIDRATFGPFLFALSCE